MCFNGLCSKQNVIDSKTSLSNQNERKSPKISPANNAVITYNLAVYEPIFKILFFTESSGHAPLGEFSKKQTLDA